MKNWTVLLLAVAVLGVGVSAPVFADEVRHDEHQANKDADAAARNQAKANEQAAEGHPMRAREDQAKANRDARGAAKNEHRAARDAR